MTAYLPPFIAILVALGVFLGYIHPTYTKDVATLKTEIGNYDRALVAASDYLSKQDEIAEKRKTLTDEDVARLKGFLPDGVDNVQLIIDLNALATGAGLSVSDIDVKGSGDGPARPASSAPTNTQIDPATGRQVASAPLTKGTPTDSVDLSVKLTGTYTNLFTFLSAVENSLRPLDVVALTMQEVPQSSLYTFTMTIRVYWLR